jgi:hypothetical protein
MANFKANAVSKRNLLIIITFLIKAKIGEKASRKLKIKGSCVRCRMRAAESAKTASFPTLTAEFRILAAKNHTIQQHIQTTEFQI